MSDDQLPPQPHGLHRGDAGNRLQKSTRLGLRRFCAKSYTGGREGGDYSPGTTASHIEQGGLKKIPHKDGGFLQREADISAPAGAPAQVCGPLTSARLWLIRETDPQQGLAVGSG